MSDFEAYRSREIVWAKQRKDGKNADIFYTKDGKVMPAEVFKRQYEKLEPEQEPG